MRQPLLPAQVGDALPSTTSACEGADMLPGSGLLYMPFCPIKGRGSRQ